MRKWVSPKAVEENLAANQNIAVSACIVGTIQCQYPGNGRSNGQAVFDDYNGEQSGWWTDNEKKLHGICGNDADISFADATGSGYEKNNGVTDTSRPIYSITGYTAKVGTYYGVTWKSKDLSKNLEYSHKGRLIISQIDTNRPNHS